MKRIIVQNVPGELEFTFQHQDTNCRIRLLPESNILKADSEEEAHNRMELRNALYN